MSADEVQQLLAPARWSAPGARGLSSAISRDTPQRAVGDKTWQARSTDHVSHSLPAQDARVEGRFFLSACNPVQEFQPGRAPRPAPVRIGSGDDDLRLG